MATAAANAYDHPTTSSLVQVELTPYLLDALSIAHDRIVGTMTRGQAQELLWALDATLRGDSRSDDELELLSAAEAVRQLSALQPRLEAACADPEELVPDDAPGVISDAIALIESLADCGDPDCSHPGCASADVREQQVTDLGPKKAVCVKCGKELIQSLTGAWLTAELAGHPGSSFCGLGWHEVVTA